MLTLGLSTLLISAPVLILIAWIVIRPMMHLGRVAPNPLIAEYLRPSPWLILSLVSIVGVFLSLFGLTVDLSRSSEQIIRESRGGDIMIILDISRSMLAEDIAPTRLDRAKEVLRGFLTRLSTDRVGLIVFAGKPFLLSPSSADMRGLSALLDRITPDTIRQDLPGLSGTAIGDAILLADSSLSGSTARTRSIILLTDGTYNIGMDPIVAAEESRSLGLPIFSVGIGNPSETYLYTTDASGARRYFYDEKWEKVRVDLDEKALQSIADRTGGQYYHAQSADALSRIFEEIRSRTQTQIITRQMTGVESMAIIFLSLLLVMIVIDRLSWWQYRSKLRI